MFGIIELLPFLFVGLILQWLRHIGQKPPQPPVDPEANFKKAVADYLAAALTDAKSS